MTLTKDGYLPRLVDKEIESILGAMGAVCIEGPKWCGKTWTALNHANSTFDLSDPTRNFQNRMLAETEVESALKGELPHHIDEWQEVPKIWDAVRTDVDKGRLRGKFILTGSSTPERKGIMHSGAGRIGTIRMHTMSLLESNDSSGAVSFQSVQTRDENHNRQGCRSAAADQSHCSRWLARIPDNVDRPSDVVAKNVLGFDQR